ncbi:MAG: flavin reductase [Chloroflexi bacterium AL-W]|nr:flavin reductase [Chloroflexi bacterium AL-N1]NOK68043.1 flavin reductase [Chloroflexi bacterium AL-N10]NOK73383.1 flavin reductase [Chloroflexi bacterium AL-N5]NOK83297.1 flavin reductase [Chloroflexi bacterium AL-W]NOK87714.1 flavin reductase [Chloroflexi bacterium AL-N15]
MAIDEARFRQTMGYFASSVTVVTTQYNHQPYGITVSSFASLSLRPPLVLICIDTSLRTHDAIISAGCFAVNFLEKHQEHLSRRFASRDDNKFVNVSWFEGQLGLPLLENVHATIECKLHNTLPGGDHSIFVGEVAFTEVYEGSPLLYYRRGYHELKS